MNIPVLILLGFAAWTLIILSIGVGGYRWALILSGRASVAGWRADAPQGADWYRRVMRAHMNCVENLPVYGAIVVALTVVGLRSPLVDGLSETMLAARIGQTLVHVALRQTNAVVSVRFTLFSIQLICVFAMGAAAAAAMIH
jgi:uncharacterized MAPEG superfamily protein